MKQLFANNQGLVEDKKYSVIDAGDAVAGDGTLIIESIVGFAVNKILFIGEPGSETAEIIKTHAATAPTGTTVTLASNLIFDHAQGTRVYITSYDQVEFSWAATVTGTKTVLDTIAVQPDQLETQYEDSTQTSGYYFIRFKNTIDSTFSDYSDPIPYGGYGDNTLGSAIEYALHRNKLDGFTSNITHDFLVDEAKNCLRFAHGKLRHWHNLQEFDYILGATSRGAYKFTLPTDAWQFSNRSILGFRVGTGTNLVYKDKAEFEEYLENVKHNTLASGALIGETSVSLNNSNDFEASGSVMIAGQVITYTTNTTGSGVLSGIPASGDGSITTNVSANDDVWQGDYEESKPSIFTVYDGYIYYWPLCDAANIKQNAYLDYWKEAPTVDSDNDTLNFGRYDMVKYWLTAAIRAQVKNDGMRDPNDEDFRTFSQILYDAITQELRTHGQKYKLKPSINRIQR